MTGSIHFVVTLRSRPFHKQFQTPITLVPALVSPGSSRTSFAYNIDFAFLGWGWAWGGVGVGLSIVW